MSIADASPYRWLAATEQPAKQQYGPVNLLRTAHTPFDAPAGALAQPAGKEPAPGPPAVSSKAAEKALNPASTGRQPAKLPEGGTDPALRRVNELFLDLEGTSLKLPFETSLFPVNGRPERRSFQPIEIGTESTPARRSLGDRLVTSKLYLPGGMVIGRTAEFTIKGRPGSKVALAMADRNNGAKPIYGHPLRLGPDRKVVSLGEIPASGILTLVIDTPIQGDQIGQFWFFEAALWTHPDFSDLEIATPVNYLGQESTQNGVMVMPEPDLKRGIRFVTESAVPFSQKQAGGTGLDAGKP